MFVNITRIDIFIRARRKNDDTKLYNNFTKLFIHQKSKVVNFNFISQQSQVNIPRNDNPSLKEAQVTCT